MRILVIEDDPKVASFIQSGLEQEELRRRRPAGWIACRRAGARDRLRRGRSSTAASSPPRLRPSPDSSRSRHRSRAWRCAPSTPDTPPRAAAAAHDAGDLPRGAQFTRHQGPDRARGRDQLERIALQDEYFIEKKLYPNIDFYSGITLKAMGFPVRCSPRCLRSRAPSAGSRNGKKDRGPGQKIGHPRQLYIGATGVPYVPVDRRG